MQLDSKISLEKQGLGKVQVGHQLKEIRHDLEKKKSNYYSLTLGYVSQLTWNLTYATVTISSGLFLLEKGQQFG